MLVLNVCSWAALRVRALRCMCVRHLCVRCVLRALRCLCVGCACVACGVCLYGCLMGVTHHDVSGPGILPFKSVCVRCEAGLLGLRRA